MVSRVLFWLKGFTLFLCWLKSDSTSPTLLKISYSEIMWSDSDPVRLATPDSTHACYFNHVQDSLGRLRLPRVEPIWRVWHELTARLSLHLFYNWVHSGFTLVWSESDYSWSSFLHSTFDTLLTYDRIENKTCLGRAFILGILYYAYFKLLGFQMP